MFLLTNEGISATQWVLLGLILVLIILYPVFTVYKNKKEKEKFEGLAKDLKVGDKILTSSGTYGEIVSISEREYGKVLTIKTGDDVHFGYMAVDVLTVYSVFRDEEMIETAAQNSEQEIKAEELSAEDEVEVEIVEEPAKKASTNKKADAAKKPASKSTKKASTKK